MIFYSSPASSRWLSPAASRAARMRCPMVMVFPPGKNDLPPLYHAGNPLSKGTMTTRVLPVCRKKMFAISGILGYTCLIL